MSNFGIPKNIPKVNMHHLKKSDFVENILFSILLEYLLQKENKIKVLNYLEYYNCYLKYLVCCFIFHGY